MVEARIETCHFCRVTAEKEKDGGHPGNTYIYIAPKDWVYDELGDSGDDKFVPVCPSCQILLQLAREAWR